MALPAKCNNTFSTSDEACAIKTPHQGICPDDWHIPSNADWDKLYRSVDGTSGTESPYHSTTAGKHLKADNGWNDYNGQSGNGTDKSGFKALPGGLGAGQGKYSGMFDKIGRVGNWWSSSESYDSDMVWSRYIRNGGDDAMVDRGDDLKKSDLLSIRCVKN